MHRVHHNTLTAVFLILNVINTLFQLSLAVYNVRFKKNKSFFIKIFIPTDFYRIFKVIFDVSDTSEFNSISNNTSIKYFLKKHNRSRKTSKMYISQIHFFFYLWYVKHVSLWCYLWP